MSSSITASPAKSALEEVQALRQLFRSTLRSYTTAVEARLEALHEALLMEAQQESPHHRDAGDIITLIRMLSVEPEKGRRRDLKKIEAVIDDTSDIAARWTRKKRPRKGEKTP